MIVDSFFKQSLTNLVQSDTSYYCFSLYHVLFSLIDAYENNGHSNTIVLSDQIGEESFALYERLKSLTLFENVILVQDVGNNSKFKFGNIDILSRFLPLIFIRRIYPFISQLKSQRNYIFFDRPILAQAVLEVGNGVVLVEDAPVSLAAFNFKSTRSRRVLEFFNVIPKLGGMHQNIREILASPATIMHQSLSGKRRDVNYGNFFTVGNSTRRTILYVFGLSEDVVRGSFSDSVIVLTQPLYQDRFLQSAAKQLSIYERVIGLYPGKTVILKKHPRDHIDYSPIISKNVTVLSGYFPVEVFTCLNVEFEESVTLFSSSIIQAKKSTKLGVNFDQELAESYKEYSSAID